MRVIIIMNIIMNLYSLSVYFSYNCIGNVTGNVAHALTVSSRPTLVGL